MGVIEHVMESFHDLLAEEPESPSGSNSSKGSHHPSRECFMMGTPEGHVESIHEEEATPMTDIDDEVERDDGSPCWSQSWRATLILLRGGRGKIP